MYISRIIISNRAPFDFLDLELKQNGLNILSAVNGKGKTTILSHIVDSIIEMARPEFSNSFEGVENKYYRLSSSVFNMDKNRCSFVYLRYIEESNNYDYIDCRGHIVQEEYEERVPFLNRIPYKDIASKLNERNVIKMFSKSFKKKTSDIFKKNVLTYFPAYRYEIPGYLNSVYKPDFGFSKEMSYTYTLENPIEVTTGVDKITDWILDIVLDWEVNKTTKRINIPGIGNKEVILGYGPEIQLWNNLCKILEGALYAKHYTGKVRFGIGPRYDAGKRLAIMNDLPNGESIELCPNIIYLSSGEISILSLFAEILRQGDKLVPNSSLSSIHGIVLIDEIDKHLHIKQQKEVMPFLFNLFPNVQFIMSSHSPFMNMGLYNDKSTRERTVIIDLDNEGLLYPIELYDNSIYKEAYEMLITDNTNYGRLLKKLQERISQNTIPLIITEGKTDVMHIQTALHKLKAGLNVEFYPIENDWGDTKLKNLLENLSKIKQHRKIIGIFDRDDIKDTYVNYTDANNCNYKKIGIPDSNVFAFCIPLVDENGYGTKISIEHYYKRVDLTKYEPGSNRRIFLGDEFYPNGISKDKLFMSRTNNIQNKLSVNGVMTEKVYKIDDCEMKQDVALSKVRFAQLMSTDEAFSNDVDFSSFQKIILILKEIIES